MHANFNPFPMLMSLFQSFSGLAISKPSIHHHAMKKMPVGPTFSQCGLKPYRQKNDNVWSDQFFVFDFYLRPSDCWIPLNYSHMPQCPAKSRPHRQPRYEPMPFAWTGVASGVSSAVAPLMNYHDHYSHRLVDTSGLKQRPKSRRHSTQKSKPS